MIQYIHTFLIKNVIFSRIAYLLLKTIPSCLWVHSCSLAQTIQKHTTASPHQLSFNYITFGYIWVQLLLLKALHFKAACLGVKHLSFCMELTPLRNRSSRGQPGIVLEEHFIRATVSTLFFERHECLCNCVRRFENTFFLEGKPLFS